jgi:conjugative transposon TraJ protein
MKRSTYFILPLLIFNFLPQLVHAQVSAGVSELHTVLDNVYNQMIPLCSNVINIAQAVAGMGCIFYIGVRVWKHIARAEPIDFFPLFRPFIMVLLIGIFPQVLATINGILSPTVTYTAAMVQHSNDAVNALLLVQAAQLTGGDNASVLMTPNPQGSQQGWDKYSQPGSTDSGSGGGFWSAIGAGFKFLAGGIEAALRFVGKFVLSIILEVLYYAASLCIDTIRVFQLIVLAILGPFAFAFSCYDGFQNSLIHWLGRYINIYLWLPIANLLGAILGQIQQNMIQIDLARVQSGTISLFSATDFAYLIFLLIGVVGYTTIPGLANYIVHTHGPNPLAQKITSLASMAVSAAVGGAAGGGGGAAAGAGSGGSSAGGSTAGYQASSSGSASDPNQYNRDKIAG